MAEIELITFDKGINTERGPLTLEEGEMISSEGVSYDSGGTVTPMPSRVAVNSTAVGSIHTLHRFNNYLYCGDGNTARYKWDLDGYCGLYEPPNGDFTTIGTLLGSNRWRVVDANDFSFIVNGMDSKALSGGNWYDWAIHNPVAAPTGTAGSTSDPSGTYSLYYTYLIKFPNGRIVETGPSPAGSVTVSSQAITWGNIGVCPYTGTGLVIHRKLYRTSSSLVETYLVTTISDNTTTTYSDTLSDAALETIGTVISTEDYNPAPEKMTDVTWYLERVFGIKGSYLYMSEPYLPFNFEWDSSIQVTREGEDLIAVRKWGDQLFLASADAWYRLQGSTVSSWAIKNTWAEQGVINPNSTVATRYGLIGQWHDGIYLFDGSFSSRITKGKIAESTFTSMTSPKSAFAEWDGTKYWFAYPSTGTTIDKVLVIDFTDYPKLKFYNDNFIINAFEYHFPSGIKYYGKADGYQYQEATGATLTFSIQTGDRAAKNIFRNKQAEYLYYDINTGGKDVTVTIYVDGTVMQTITLNESSRKRDRHLLKQMEGYRYSVKIECDDASGVTIYAPWALSLNPVGV